METPGLSRLNFTATAYGCDWRILLSHQLAPATHYLGVFQLLWNSKLVCCISNGKARTAACSSTHDGVHMDPTALLPRHISRLLLPTYAPRVGVKARGWAPLPVDTTTIRIVAGHVSDDPDDRLQNEQCPASQDDQPAGDEWNGISTHLDPLQLAF